MVLLCNGNEIPWVRSYLGTNKFGYEPVWVRTSLVTKSPDFLATPFFVLDFPGASDFDS